LFVALAWSVVLWTDAWMFADFFAGLCVAAAGSGIRQRRTAGDVLICSVLACGAIGLVVMMHV